MIAAVAASVDATLAADAHAKRLRKRHGVSCGCDLCGAAERAIARAAMLRVYGDAWISMSHAQRRREVDGFIETSRAIMRAVLGS